ncbi:hypothetical protein ANANG_G00273760, partial [Anguilla anguilla]
HSLTHKHTRSLTSTLSLSHPLSPSQPEITANMTLFSALGDTHFCDWDLVWLFSSVLHGIQ